MSAHETITKEPTVKYSRLAQPSYKKGDTQREGHRKPHRERVTRFADQLNALFGLGQTRVHSRVISSNGFKNRVQKRDVK
jgi:hypothetical protein